ncbi:hypothetical protein BT63DRAFT_459286 [Microthyrium microscopicum]|uniref:Mid2 domain-containing protein n=1 Tax=Microthyrium microscopicum TaxID=703497 RepID=A0A6A6U052_9PEZI|nr:hypothetical protein BT63DRAFT_459286 [Microthyrium microscopicum]
MASARKRPPCRWTIGFVSWIVLVSSFTNHAYASDEKKHSTAKEESKHPKPCFFPSGVVSFGAPCYDDHETSRCCGFGWSCMSNGLCKTGPSNEKNFKSQFFRGSCTDQTWGNPACNDICRGAEDNLDSSQPLQVCDSTTGTYCCERDFNCCTNSTLTFVLGPPKVLRAIVRPTHLDAPPDEESVATGLRKETIIGVAVGFSIAAVFFLLGWAAWIWRRRRAARKLLPAKPRDNAKELDSTPLNSWASSSGTGRKSTEVTQIEVVELESPSTNRRSELDSILVSPITMRSRTGTFASGSSMIPESEMTMGTLVTDEILELAAQEKDDRGMDKSAARRVESSRRPQG